MNDQGTVVVIDDDELIRELLKSLLAKEGYLVHEASDGLEGLQKIKDIKPDIVFCDRLMPKMSGVAVREYLQERMPETKTEFVFLTSLTDARDKHAVINLNVSDYLEKPVTPATLHACLQHLKDRNLSPSL